MIKRVIAILVATMALTCSAQSDGQWKAHPTYLGSGAKNLIDAGNKVYFLNGTSLFQYDKATEKVTALNKENGASDITVTNIYYNYAANYMLVTYNNSNIDIVRADGGVVNLPDIKDVVYNGKKGINDVTFSNGKAYIATQFGYVVIDDKTLQISETYYYNCDIASVAQVGNTLVLSYEDELYFDTRKHHDDFSKFSTTGYMFKATKLFPVSDEKLFIYATNSFSEASCSAETGELGNFKTIVSATANNVQRTPSGLMANFQALGYYYTFDEAGENATKVTATKEFFSSHPAGDGKMWALDALGLHEKGNTSHINPNGVGITKNAFWTAYNPGEGKLYVSRTTDNSVISEYSGAVTEVWTYDGKNWVNETPANAPKDNGNTWLEFEPGTKNSYFYTTRSKYIVHVNNGEIVQQHDANNSLIKSRNALRFDKYGNLWGVQSSSSAAGQSVVVLPKEKLNETPSAGNWIKTDVQATTGSFKRSSMTISKGSDTKVYDDGDSNGTYGKLIIWRNNSDLNNLNTESKFFNRIPDTDGTTMQWQKVLCLASDNTDNVWVGTTSGLFYFNAGEAFNDDFKVKRPKQSSTSMSYLLDGEAVQTITVDSLNRVWVGTATQGVYLLNEDGSETLAQFDTSNSGLPSNNIYSICPIPNRNSVMFVTNNGLAEYFEKPSEESLAEKFTHAFPNPVMPNFTGYVTITGLSDNAIVKITNRQGVVVALLQANGSVAHWDACDETTGERLPTGVYNVYAGSSEDNMSQTAITQVRIIK